MLLEVGDAVDKINAFAFPVTLLRLEFAHYLRGFLVDLPQLIILVLTLLFMKGLGWLLLLLLFLRLTLYCLFLLFLGELIGPWVNSILEIMFLVITTLLEIGEEEILQETTVLAEAGSLTHVLGYLRICVLVVVGFWLTRTLPTCTFSFLGRLQSSATLITIRHHRTRRLLLLPLLFPKLLILRSNRPILQPQCILKSSSNTPAALALRGLCADGRRLEGMPWSRPRGVFLELDQLGLLVLNLALADLPERD